jgi:hypothetical protein
MSLERSVDLPRKTFSALAVSSALLFAMVNLPQAGESETAVAPAMDRWVELLEGGWQGEGNRTPIGVMPFAMLFDRQPDGSLRSFSAFHRDTWVEMRVWRTQAGAWRLEEAASLEGLGQQRRTLEPAGVTGVVRRWVAVDDPDELAIDMAIEGHVLYIDVWLRGLSHARFQLERVPDEQIPAMRRALEMQAARTPEEAGSLFAYVSPGSPAGPRPDAEGRVDRARGAIEESPHDARAHMALAGALIDAIEADPARGRALSKELLRALETAHGLDREWAAPYHGLIGYFLSAPRIAGGSIEKARAMAEELATIDEAAGSRRLAEIDDHDAATASAWGVDR